MAPQLAALDAVARLLDGARIDYWLFGGWAVDLYAGRVTRPHDDIDLAVWLADVPRSSQLLNGDGWRHAPQEGDDGGTGYERAGVRLELTYLERDGAEVFTTFGFGRGIWPADAFAADECELEGVRSRVLALPALKQAKSDKRGDAADQAKDRADLTILEQL